MSRLAHNGTPMYPCYLEHHSPDALLLFSYPPPSFVQKLIQLFFIVQYLLE